MRAIILLRMAAVNASSCEGRINMSIVGPATTPHP
jgi:hypothetical protein